MQIDFDEFTVDTSTEQGVAYLDGLLDGSMTRSPRESLAYFNTLHASMQLARLGQDQSEKVLRRFEANQTWAEAMAPLVIALRDACGRAQRLANVIERGVADDVLDTIQAGWDA